jgi:hypothetical protein
MYLSANPEGEMMMVKVHTARFTVTPEYAVFAASTVYMCTCMLIYMYMYINECIYM